MEAGNYATQFARRQGFESEGGFFNPGRREGLKLAFLEACEQLDQPIDWYVQAVAGLMKLAGAGGIAKSAVVMVNLTGADRPEPPKCAGVQWIEEADWRPSMDGHSTHLRA